METRKYDVAISFTLENREQARNLASSLRDAGLSVFFDQWASEELWGKNLHEHLTSIYLESFLTILVISSSYSKKIWTRTELKSLVAQALQSPDYTILPIRVDDSPFPAELSSIAYVDLRESSYAEIAELVKDKLESVKREKRYRFPTPAKTYHVIPRFQDWALKRSGASRATAVYASKDEVLRKVEELLERSKDIEIVIHKSDGTIEERIDANTKKAQDS